MTVIVQDVLPPGGGCQARRQDPSADSLKPIMITYSRQTHLTDGVEHVAKTKTNSPHTRRPDTRDQIAVGSGSADPWSLRRCEGR
jgi:hypothetical protein